MIIKFNLLKYLNDRSTYVLYNIYIFKVPNNISHPFLHVKNQINSCHIYIIQFNHNLGLVPNNLLRKNHYYYISFMVIKFCTKPIADSFLSVTNIA